MTKKPKKPATPIKTYAKVPLSVDDALSHLWQRRLMIDDRSNNARALRSIGYFRLWPNIPDPLLVSWLHSLTDLRNACAHHSRLWNVKLAVSTPQQPKSVALAGYAAGMHPNWTYYARAVIVKALLDPMGHGAEWRESLKTTLGSCRHVDVAAHLGFQQGWEITPAWA